MLFSRATQLGLTARGLSFSSITSQTKPLFCSATLSRSSARTHAGGLFPRSFEASVSRRVQALSRHFSDMQQNNNHSMVTAVSEDDTVDRLEPEEHKYDYDLIVIGGGSGGLACSKEAAAFGKKVAVFDFVQPTPRGTTWGLGGTCVNVGCIPKKLFHASSLLGDAIMHDAKPYGWQVPDNVPFTWDELCNNVQDYIAGLNFGYRTDLRDKKVEYKNEYAVFIDPHTIQATNQKGQVNKYTARRFVIATGGRPKYPGIPGDKEHGITSDDVFSLLQPPGRTLVVGASYVALECAGFLHAFGYPTTVMARSIFLRGFDQQMAGLVADHMEAHGVQFVRPAVPTRVEPAPDGKQKRVFYRVADNAPEQSADYDTVLFAIGRVAETSKLGLERIGVVVDAASGKIPAPRERTSVPHVYAIGDVLKDRLELTPVAIRAGKLLARRLYGNAKAWMDYHNVPTCVFTPLEYGSVGMSEEDAVRRYGADQIEVYHSFLKPLEWTVPKRDENRAYAKLICLRSDRERVLGLHIAGPNAGEITQGYGVAVRLGATKADFDSTVGIHPTVAEDLLTLGITKRSGVSPLKKGC